MKVHELIESLLKMPREADVYLFGDSALAKKVELHDISDPWDKVKTPPHVSIEGE